MFIHKLSAVIGENVLLYSHRKKKKKGFHKFEIEKDLKNKGKQPTKQKNLLLLVFRIWRPLLLHNRNCLQPVFYVLCSSCKRKLLFFFFNNGVFFNLLIKKPPSSTFWNVTDLTAGFLAIFFLFLSFLVFWSSVRGDFLLFHYHFCIVDGWWSFFATSHELLLLSTAVDVTQEKRKNHFRIRNFAFPRYWFTT